MALPLSDAAARREARPVLGGDGRALGPGLPAQQPIGAARAHLVPGGKVVLGEGAQQDPPAAQLQGGVADGPRRAHRPSTSARAASNVTTLRRRAVLPMQPIRQICPASCPAPAPISIPYSESSRRRTSASWVPAGTRTVVSWGNR